MEYLKLMLALSIVLCTTKVGAVNIPHSFNDSSDASDAKFFWSLKKKPHNAIVVVANFSAENDGERSSKRIGGTDSLSPDKDKTQIFVNQYHVTEPDIQDLQTRHIPDKFSFGSFAPSFKLPSLLEKKTILLTTTLLHKQTLYNTVYPSCLLLQNVQSVCDGVLKTILPSRHKPTADIWLLKQTAVIESIEKDEDSERFIQPSSTVSIAATSTASPKLDPKAAALEDLYSSEWNSEDGRKLESLDNLAKATPTLTANEGSVRSEVADEARLIQFLEPHVQFVTKYLTIEATETRRDTAHTATVIAENCLPADLQVPLCSSYPFPGQPIAPFFVDAALSPYSRPHGEQPPDEEVTGADDDVMKRTVDRMRAQIRQLVVDDVRRMTDESGHTPQLFQLVDVSQSAEPLYVRAYRSTKNDDLPAPAA